MKNRYNICLDQDLHHDLEELAKSRETSISEIVNTACQAYLARPEMSRIRSLLLQMLQADDRRN